VEEEEAKLSVAKRLRMLWVVKLKVWREERFWDQVEELVSGK
jgi:hypothetical protein